MPWLSQASQQRLAVLEGAELHLVDHRGRAGDAHHLLDLGHAEVRDADRARVAALAGRLHPRPGPGRALLGPVDDVEVDLLDAEPLEAVLGLGGRVGARGIELRRDEDLVARDAAVAQRAADARLVAVGLRGVDVPVARLERPAHRVLTLGAVLDLPHAQPDRGDRVTVRQGPPPAVFAHVASLGCLPRRGPYRRGRPGRRCDVPVRPRRAPPAAARGSRAR